MFSAVFYILISVRKRMDLPIQITYMYYMQSLHFENKWYHRSGMLWCNNVLVLLSFYIPHLVTVGVELQCRASQLTLVSNKGGGRANPNRNL